MTSLIRRFSATGPTLNVVSFNALHTEPCNERAITRTLRPGVSGRVYWTALGLIPPPVPPEALRTAPRVAENRKSELVEEMFSA